MIFGFNFPRIDDKLDEGENLFQKKPLGKRRHLMSGAVTRREFSVRYVWNGAKARLRWKPFFPERTFDIYVFFSILTFIFLPVGDIWLF